MKHKLTETKFKSALGLTCYLISRAVCFGAVRPRLDWTDPRPEKENARDGCKLGAGPLSIQGHDPTTDLSFRNLRAAELKKD